MIWKYVSSLYYSVLCNIMCLIFKLCDKYFFCVCKSFQIVTLNSKSHDIKCYMQE